MKRSCGLNAAWVVGGALLLALFACEDIDKRDFSDSIRPVQPARDSGAEGASPDPAAPFGRCEAGQFRCDGPALQACTQDGGAFVTLQTCESAAVCQTQPPGCGVSACAADEMTCQGNVLLTCNEDQTAFVPFATCETPAHCSSTARRCLTTPCETGDLACNRLDDGSPAIQRCNAAQTAWDLVDVCASRALCSRTIEAANPLRLPEPADAGAPDAAAALESIEVAACLAPACLPGDVQCQGASLVTCNAGQTELELVEDCASAELCVQSLTNTNAVGVASCIEAVCEAGAFECTQAGVLQVCEANRAGFRVVQACIGAAFCDAANGACNDAPCEAGAQSCNGAQPQRCRADQTGFDDLGPACVNAALCNDEAATAFCEEPLCARGAQSSSEFICTGSVLQQCNEDQNAYADVAACATPELCDRASGTCLVPTCEVNEHRCEGGTLEVCNTAQNDFDPIENCGDASQCDGSAGTCTDPCEPGTTRCSPQGELEQCADRLSGWQVIADCLTRQLCDETRGVCDTAVCSPGQRACRTQGRNEVLERCAPGRDAFETELTCQAGEICDLQNAQCDACQAGSVSCDGDTLVTCSANGQTETRQACGPGLCSATARRCLVCGPTGSARCQGAQLLVCTQGNQGEFEQGQFCESGQLCQDTLGRCGPNGCQCIPGICSPGEVTCSGNTLQQCNAGLNGFNTLDNCGPGLCNEVSERCDDCSGNTSVCINAAQRQFCSNGSFLIQNCPLGQTCSGTQCVPQVCQPNQLSCSPNADAVRRCNAQGTGFGPTTACPLGCVNNSCATCIADQCQPNRQVRRCVGGQLQAATACGGGQECTDTCRTLRCEPNQSVCTAQGDVGQCNGNGSAVITSIQGDCPLTRPCRDGACTPPCTPGFPGCSVGRTGTPDRICNSVGDLIPVTPAVSSACADAPSVTPNAFRCQNGNAVVTSCSLARPCNALTGQCG